MWIGKILAADFTRVSDRLVGSIPGRHTANRINKFGHLKLRELLKASFTSDELIAQNTRISQISSIGVLGNNAFDWLCEEFLRSLAGEALVDPNRK